VPDHPDAEQLAAFQAGDGDRRQRAEVEAHLAGCPACAEAVASVEQARGQLALLEEPELPAGLHDRLAAAVDAEAATGRVEGGTRSRLRRTAPWYRRPVAWGAAAALLLAALVAVPLLDQSSEVTPAGGASGAQAAREADASAAAAVPLLRVPGEISVATVRSRLATDNQARAALDAANARRGAGAPGADSGAGAGVAGGEGAVQTQSSDSPAAPTTPAAPSQDLSRSAGRPTGRPAASAPAALAPCLTAATAAADPTTLPLTPAFYLEGAYQGRPATILVTTGGGQPGRVDLWAFPRDDCSSPPLASERVR
jgi:Putative zinc-finger